jgi:hypothetical protein
MISAAEIVRRIAAAPAPVLLSDSCSLLDLMRDPTREDVSQRNVEAANRLIAGAEGKPPTVWFPSANQVMVELQGNQDKVKQEAERAIIRLEISVDRVRGIMAAHGLHPRALDLGLSTLGFTDAASSLIKRYIAAGFHVRNSRGVDRRALARMAASLAPSQKGQQTKDCLVIEAYLHIAQELRRRNVQVPIVFLTSNTRDYSDGVKDGTIHPTLRQEFSALNLEYAVNLQMAEYLLGLSPPP